MQMNDKLAPPDRVNGGVQPITEANGGVVCALSKFGFCEKWRNANANPMFDSFLLTWIYGGYITLKSRKEVWFESSERGAIWLRPRL